MRVLTLIVCFLTLSACIDIKEAELEDSLVKHQIFEANAAFLPVMSSGQRTYNLSHIRRINFEPHQGMVINTAIGAVLTVTGGMAQDFSQGESLYLIRVREGDSGETANYACVVGKGDVPCLAATSVEMKGE